MEKKKRYRNVIRSKKLIRQAFLELLREHPFENITVTAIVEKADINRSTFYGHYPDVMGIVEEIEKETVEYTKRILEEIEFDNFADEPEKYIKMIFKSLEDNREWYYLLGHSDVSVKQLEKIKSAIIENIIETLKSYEHYIMCEDYVFVTHFLVGGMMEICKQWIFGGIEASYEEIVEKMTKFVVKVCKELL